MLVPCNFNNDYKKIFLNKFKDNDYKQPYIVKFVVVYLSNVVVLVKSSAIWYVAHCSVVRWGGLSSSSTVCFFGAAGHCLVPFGPLGGGVSLPGAPPISPCGSLLSGGGLRRGLLPEPPALSSSLGLPGGDGDGCAGFDAGFSINKTISALFHST